MSATATRIYLLRHGETTAGDCFLGVTDSPLTKNGWQQMQKSLGNNLDFQLVVSSPLKRCREFAESVAEKNNLQLMISEAFQELNFGDWEAKTSEELWQTDRERLSAFWADPVNHSPPGGETLCQLSQRVENAIKVLAKNYPGKKILLVAHGGVIRCVLAWVLGMPLSHLNKINIRHASMSCIQISMQGKEYFPVVDFAGLVTTG